MIEPVLFGGGGPSCRVSSHIVLDLELFIGQDVISNGDHLEFFFVLRLALRRIRMVLLCEFVEFELDLFLSRFLGQTKRLIVVGVLIKVMGRVCEELRHPLELSPS